MIKTNCLFLIFVFGVFITKLLNAQPAPLHLKYFGFAAIDCFYDDSLDNSKITN